MTAAVEDHDGIRVHIVGARRNLHDDHVLIVFPILGEPAQGRFAHRPAIPVADKRGAVADSEYDEATGREGLCAAIVVQVLPIVIRRGGDSRIRVRIREIDAALPVDIGPGARGHGIDVDDRVANGQRALDVDRVPME